ncbi:unnamed protein product [Strongylus vulgaris]|uniref:Uncharacterized protein n=1 Tax=Strongylus vulgaris TaxID=40348 RepID=A0A3P7J6M3_STRVU|nr:unnamed protein product [Strongylus vulgaris]
MEMTAAARTMATQKWADRLATPANMRADGNERDDVSGRRDADSDRGNNATHALLQRAALTQHSKKEKEVVEVVVVVGFETVCPIRALRVFPLTVTDHGYETATEPREALSATNWAGSRCDDDPRIPPAQQIVSISIIFMHCEFSLAVQCRCGTGRRKQSDARHR